MISVIVPTIDGREDYLNETLQAYRDTTPDVQLIVVRNKPVVGVAWNVGSLQATGDYIHLTADDIIPHEGWWQAGCPVCDAWNLPAPLIYNTDGSVQSCGEYGMALYDDGTEYEFSRIPLMSMKQWELIRPVVPLHYYTDNWISYKGKLNGMKVLVTKQFCFTHHLAPIGRVDYRMSADGAAYSRYIQEGYP